ncbi:hypothetical protein CWI36_0446p0010, partial [Hamiltosporidium magnivora]
MSNSFSGKNTNENKYEFHVGETSECIECENDNVLKKQKVSINDRERIIEKTLEGYSMSAIASIYRIYYQTVNCIGKRFLKTGLIFVEKRAYVDLECTKTLYELAEWSKCTFNVDMSTSTIDRALREFDYTPKRGTLVHERRNSPSKIEIRTNYATSFREL